MRMKYVAGANKFTNKATQVASHAFSKKKILKETLEGHHKGEPMLQVFLNIINDPNVEIGDADKHGNQIIFFKGKNVGWINPVRFVGWVDDKAYEQMQKYVPEVDYLDDEDDFGGYLDGEDDDWGNI